MENIVYFYGVGIAVWIYAFISVLSNEFKSGSTKIVWILALIFFPVSCLLYPFLKSKQIKDVTSTSSIDREDIVMWTSIIVGMGIASFIVSIVINNYNMELNYFIRILIIMILGIGIMFIFAAIYGVIRSFFGRYSNQKEIIKNANDGITADQNRLGVMYENGDYVEKDLAKAIDWYEKAAEKNNAWGLYNLGEKYYEGTYFNQNYVKAHELYIKAANQNHSNAQNKLGIIYDNGYGVEIDSIEAFKWFEKAACNGFHWAQSNLANMYYNGVGTEKDYQKAYELYKKASEHNNKVAIVKLAHMYLLGEGVSENFEYAKELLSELHQKGDENAIDLWKSYKLDSV